MRHDSDPYKKFIESVYIHIKFRSTFRSEEETWWCDDLQRNAIYHSIRPSSSVHTETEKSLKDTDDCIWFSVPGSRNYWLKSIPSYALYMPLDLEEGWKEASEVGGGQQGWRGWARGKTVHERKVGWALLLLAARKRRGWNNFVVIWFYLPSFLSHHIKKYSCARWRVCKLRLLELCS